MRQTIIAYIQRRREKGQSLVEVALFFPIFLILLAGVVEVSNLAITQNRVSNAARAGTRFASQGGENVGIPIVVLNSVTQTLQLGEDVWDMWVIRGKLTQAGGCCESWEFTHVYGLQQTKAFTSVNEIEIQEKVVEELQVGGASGASELEFVGTYLVHDIHSILGLQAIPDLIGYSSVRGLNVMRVFSREIDQTGGCDGFPIGIEAGIRSVYPPLIQQPQDNPDPYPATDQFHSTSPKPSYSQFFRNSPNVPLSAAQQGNVYKIYHSNPPASGRFSWVAWNNGVANNQATLNASLLWPGNSRDYSNAGPCSGSCPTPVHSYLVRGYVNPYANLDLNINTGDWLTINSGATNGGSIANMEEHMTKGRYLRLMVWEHNPGSNPPSPHTTNGRTYIKVTGFAVFRLLGHNLSNGWILAEFIQWDSSCGQST